MNKCLTLVHLTSSGKPNQACSVTVQMRTSGLLKCEAPDLGLHVPVPSGIRNGQMCSHFCDKRATKDWSRVGSPRLAPSSNFLIAHQPIREAASDRGGGFAFHHQARGGAHRDGHPGCVATSNKRMKSPAESDGGTQSVEPRTTCPIPLACSERHFFFSSEVQLATTMSGGDSPVLTSWLSRNFCPPVKTK